MKRFTWVVVVLMSPWMLHAQDKPRVFVKGQGTTNSMTKAAGYDRHGWFAGRADSVVDAHDESIELTKDLRAQCPGITVTLREDAADFVVMLNRESKAKKGLLSKNSQVLVANRQGDVIWTKDVRQVASAAKDACAAMLSAPRLGSQPDEQSAPPPAKPQAAPPTVAPAAPQPPQQAVVQLQQPAPASAVTQAVPSSTVYGSTLSRPGEKDGPSLGDVARKYREQKAKEQATEQKVGQQ